jgi:serine/threonine-protein kinase
MAPRAFDTDRIGPYRILYASDGAGMTSFVAREEGPVGFQRDVVLKIVPEGDPERVADARELAQEATLGSRLNHPNIVRNHDFFAQDGRLVLVQEHVDGVTLAELLSALRERTERLSDAAALTIGVAVLEALAHAHALVDGSGARSPVAHRRIVPAAIALGRDGAVKLGGFSATPLATDLVSSVGAAPGFAPAADDSGERSDVHAAGRLLWQLLTGREPGADLEPLAVLRADLPRELCAAVSAALDVTAS